MEALAAYYAYGLTYRQMAKALRLETRSSVAGLIRRAREQGYITDRRKPEKERA